VVGRFCIEWGQGAAKLNCTFLPNAVAALANVVKVITMEMMGRVRRMKLRDGISNSEIAKRTGLSRNTVKKWLKAAGDEVPKYKRSSGKATKLSAYEDTVVAALKADAHRPKEHRRTARALFAQIQGAGLSGRIYRADQLHSGLARAIRQRAPAGICAVELRVG
jgi:transcriptional regulator with XRE-family HTH domain